MTVLSSTTFGAGYINNLGAFAVDVTNGLLYWSSFNDNKFFRGNLDGSGTPQLLFNSVDTTQPWALDIDPITQPPSPRARTFRKNPVQRTTQAAALNKCDCLTSSRIFCLFRHVMSIRRWLAALAEGDGRDADTMLELSREEMHILVTKSFGNLADRQR